jgi:uncharacterized protein (UPF0261 family)
LLVGTFDTKGKEFLFVKDILEKNGVGTITIDIGLRKNERFISDYTNEEVLSFSGTNIAELSKKPKVEAEEIMIKSAKALVAKLVKQDNVAGILSMGGTNGTAMATAIMQAVPFGIPKVMVSTVASGDTRLYVGQSDIMMINSVVDVAGINSFSKQVFINAALSIVGMVKYRQPSDCGKKPVIAATMMGVTTPCVTYAKEYLEDKGFEFVTFHANGNGGKSLENFIDEDMFVGVLDLTTTEIINEVANGYFGAGPTRLTSAAKKGLPQVVSLGGMDMLVFREPNTIPREYKNRKIYMHTPSISLIRTNVEENITAGNIIADKLNKSAPYKTTLLIPLGGFSLMDVPGKPFYGPQEDAALIDTIKKKIDKTKIDIVECDCDINNPNFAKTAVDILLSKLGSKKLKINKTY